MWQEGVSGRQQWDVCPTRLPPMVGAQLSHLWESGIAQARVWPKTGGNKELRSHAKQLELSNLGKRNPEVSSTK